MADRRTAAGALVELARAVADKVVAQRLRESPRPTWGQVVQTQPLTVRLAGDTGETPVSLVSGGYAPAVGDRVWLMPLGQRGLLLAGRVEVLGGGPR